MFGLDLVMAGYVTLVSGSSYNVTCELKEKPRVSVTPTKSTIKYDFTKTKADLKNFEIDTDSPYDPGTKTHVGGLMSGEISTESEIGFITETYKGIDKACLYIKEINVRMHIDPTIFVAKEFRQGTCEHDAVLDHEKKHIMVDRIIVNKYAERISKTLTYAVNKYGAAFGPFSESKLPSAQKKMQDYIEGIIRDESERMNTERRTKQQAVDTREEYDRVSSLCR